MVDPRIPLDAYRPTFVRSLLVVPVGGPEPVAAIGAYWSERQVPDPGVVRLLEDLAEQTARAIDRVGLDDAPWAPTFRRSVPHPVEAR
jgi:two-component system CheB/CheR fusion protein